MARTEIGGFGINAIRPNATREFLYSGSNFPIQLDRTDDGKFKATAFGGDLEVISDSQENAVRDIRAALHQRALKGEVTV